MKKTDEPIIIEETFNNSVEAVWSALTDIDEMRLWYFDNLPAFKPEVGFQTQFNVQNEGRNFLHQWEITEVVPLKRIKYRWRFKEYQGESYVVFELFDENQQTKLRLTAVAVDSFPQDIPEFKRESGVAGWKFFINQRLKEYLDKKT